MAVVWTLQLYCMNIYITVAWKMPEVQYSRRSPVLTTIPPLIGVTGIQSPFKFLA